MENQQVAQKAIDESRASGTRVPMPNLTGAVAEKYDSVQFAISGTAGIYQFKIRCLTEKGACILVREDSSVLANLQEGAVLDMVYFQSGPANSIDELKTRIDFIRFDDQGRFQGHRLVGLSILSAPPASS